MTWDFWKTASLRSWIAIGMAVAVVPLAASAAFGYIMLHRGVLGAFQDVALRQRDELDPLQRLRLLLTEATRPVDEFVLDSDPQKVRVYRDLRARIEEAFAVLERQFGTGELPRAMVRRARNDWSDADRLAGETFALRRIPNDPGSNVLIGRFGGLIDTAVDKLGVAFDEVESDVRADHGVAIRDADRAEWFALVAAVASALAILLGLFIVGRVITGSVERLVDGAELFAAGNREHRIDVPLPPELHRVAEEFNQMITRIHQSEHALVELARRDGLTLLPNRRAFDETLDEMLARHQRLGEEWALLILDLDHFKRINDTHGHTAGDDVLRATARTFDYALRSYDHAFRIGGEEFAVLLGRTDRATASVIAERIRVAIEALHVKTATGDLSVTVSIGVSSVGAGSTRISMLTSADAALYQAKDGGRNRVVVDRT